MRRALREDEAVASAGECLDDVAQDLLVAGVVLGDLPVHRRHGTRRGQVAVTHVSEGRRVDAEVRRGAVMARRLECAGLGRLERVPYRPELERDQVVESVASVRRGGEPQPPAGRDRAGGRLECGRRDVVALVDDDLAVTAERLSEVVAPGQRLKSGDIDDPGELAPSSAELPGLDAEQSPGSADATDRRASCGRRAPGSRSSGPR